MTFHAYTPGPPSEHYIIYGVSQSGAIFHAHSLTTANLFFGLFSIGTIYVENESIIPH